MLRRPTGRRRRARGRRRGTRLSSARRYEEGASHMTRDGAKAPRGTATRAAAPRARRARRTTLGLEPLEGRQLLAFVAPTSQNVTSNHAIYKVAVGGPGAVH